MTPCRESERVSGYLDDELEGAERTAFEEHLDGCVACAEELRATRALKEVTSHMKLTEFPDEVWDRYWRNTYNRFERKIGWTLLSIGAIVLLAAGLYELARHLLYDETTPWWIRLGTGFAAAGVAVLFISVLRERLFVRRRDPYREVQR